MKDSAPADGQVKPKGRVHSDQMVPLFPEPRSSLDAQAASRRRSRHMGNAALQHGVKVNLGLEQARDVFPTRGRGTSPPFWGPSRLSIPRPRSCPRRIAHSVSRFGSRSKVLHCPRPPRCRNRGLARPAASSSPRPAGSGYLLGGLNLREERFEYQNRHEGGRY
jgi:hypothetical protein